MEKEDERCCGTGHCLIDTDGRCWCGQVWDGEKMCLPKPFKSYEPLANTETKSDTPVTSACIALDNKPV